MIVPPIFAQRSPVEIARIEDAVLRLAPFADHEKADLCFSVIEKGVRYPRAGRKSNRIARLQSMEIAVEPYIRLAFDDVDKLLLRALGVRKGCAPARRQSLVMNAQLRQPEFSAERRADAHQLIVPVI